MSQVIENIHPSAVVELNRVSPVLVQIPASTSNCGPGFDTLGVALQLYNFVRIESSSSMAIEPLESELLDPVLQQMVAEAARAYFVETDTEVHGFRYSIWGEVPIARGLGSSATIRAGIVAGLNALDGSPLTLGRCIALVSRLDHAPDNTCAAFAGGFCVARTDPASGAYREHLRFEVPDSLAFVAVSPDLEVKTMESRRVLPQQLPFDEVAQSLNSLAFLVAAFASGDYERLNGAVNDRIHQPYREILNPFAREAIAAGCEAGGYTGWLSGSGSTVVCLAPARRALRVGNAMASIFKVNGVRSRIHPLATDNVGLSVRFENP